MAESMTDYTRSSTVAGFATLDEATGGHFEIGMDSSCNLAKYNTCQKIAMRVHIY